LVCQLFGVGNITKLNLRTILFFPCCDHAADASGACRTDITHETAKPFPVNLASAPQDVE